MFEDLLTVSSSEEEEEEGDIKIVEERLNAHRKISSPSKMKKIKKIVEVLSQQGHVPVSAAAKVRNVQFFSAQGALSLEEGEERMRKKYKVKTTAVAVSRKRKKAESGVQPRPRPGVGLSQKWPNSRLPVPVKQRRNITYQLRDQVGEEVGREQDHSSSGMRLSEDSQPARTVGREKEISSEVSSGASPRHREDRAGGAVSAKGHLASSQVDLRPGGAYGVWDLLAINTSEEEEEEEEDLNLGSSSSFAANTSGAECLAQTKARFYTDLLEEEEGRELGNLQEFSPGLTLTSSASPGQELLALSSEDEEQEEERIFPDLLPFSSSEDEEDEKILSKDLPSSDISEETVVEQEPHTTSPSADSLAVPPRRQGRAEEEHQASPELPVTAGLLSGLRPSLEEEEEEEGQMKVPEVSEDPGKSQSSTGEVPVSPPVRQEGGRGRPPSDLSQAEFLRFFGLVSHQEAEQRR